MPPRSLRILALRDAWISSRPRCNTTNARIAYAGLMELAGGHGLAEARPRGQTGLVSSIRHAGPFGKSGPSDLTNAGAVPPRIHTCVSGGCFPTSGAIKPFTP